MTNIPSVPEIITVNSEALQTQVRDLLPSQNGFGSELQASNVIMPIIDLTAAAEGSGLPAYLQQALSFGSQTTNTVQNSSAVQVNAPGFYSVIAQSMIKQNNSNTVINSIVLNDGSTTKAIFNHKMPAGSSGEGNALTFQTVVFLRAGDQLDVESNRVDGVLNVTTRQLATGDGTLVQPNGFPL